MTLRARGLTGIWVLVAALCALASGGAAVSDAVGVPLAPGSPWPKFRRDAAQDGRSPLRPSMTGGRRWTVRTGGGIFASPIIGADGTVYVGSEDRRFYAISPDGRVRWRFATGGIIDSAGLLDNRGRVYVPSGDGHLYALDARTGRRIWTYAAPSASSTGAFINWFEGNVAIGPSGALYAPNDGYRTYVLDRSSGSVLWSLSTRDQTWSLPAVDPATGRLYIGNNYFLGGAANVFGLTPKGTPSWSAEVNGSVVSSPLLTRDGLVVVGGFDGYVHAYSAATGAQRWTFATRDHIYASPAQLPDGTIVIPSTDGSVYGLNPANGHERWQYDTLNPIRSSPAVDGAGEVVIATGDGRILVLDAHGHRRWALTVTHDPRATLNASPALGRDVIVAADSEGSVFSVPTDDCLRPAQRQDPDCVRGGSDGLPAGGARLYWTSPFGILERHPPRTLAAGSPLALSLVGRRRGRTILTLIDPHGLRVRARPAVPLTVGVSGDRRYVVVSPRMAYRGRSLTLTVSGRYLVDPARRGLALSGGHVGGRFSQVLHFALARGHTGGTLGGARVWTFSRLALPLPDLLPSYNQIGFERLGFLISSVRRLSGGRTLMWMVGARQAGGRWVPDPQTEYRVAYVARVRDGVLSLRDAGGSSVNLNGFNITSTFWHIAARLGADGRPLGDPVTTLEIDCAKIGFYGPFLARLGLCARGRPLQIFGAGQMARVGGQLAQTPGGVGRVTFVRSGDTLVARVSGSALSAAGHAFGVLVTDAVGTPLPLAYGTATTVTHTTSGAVAAVSVPLAGQGARAAEAYLMVGASVAASGPVRGT